MAIHSCLKINFSSNYINPNIGFRIKLDDHVQSYWFNQVDHEYVCELIDEDQSHVLTLELLGKQQFFESNENFMVQVKQVELDYVDITKFFCWTLLPYQTKHGTTTFCEYMGDDGTVTFGFQSPIYQWLKKNYTWYL